MTFSFPPNFKKYHLVKILHSFNLTQVVNSITRPLSKTCLNHIWCSHPEHLNNISVIPSGMSDHLPIVATRKYNRTRSNNSRFNTISYRNIKNLDKATFSKSLKRHLGIALFFFVNILKEIRKRDNSLKKARKSNLERDWDLYKQEKNSVSSLIRRRKQAYYKNTISENKINTRKLWNLIKSLSCDDDESQSSIEKLIDSGNVITDKTSTAEL